MVFHSANVPRSWFAFSPANCADKLDRSSGLPVPAWSFCSGWAEVDVLGAAFEALQAVARSNGNGAVGKDVPDG